MAMAGGGTGTFPWPWPRLPCPQALVTAVAVALPSHASHGAVESRARAVTGEGRGGLGKHPLNRINIS